MNDISNITADAVSLQERDEFRSHGWLKLVAPAKVNLHLAIGALRPDGYHDATTVMQSLNLHDVVYLRRKMPDDADPTRPTTRLVACGDVAIPDVPSEKNIATKAVLLLAERIGREGAGLEIRIEKNIPAEGGLGGGSSDAAAALLGAAQLWDVNQEDQVIERVARELGSDVAFFLHGGCARCEGTGEVFVRTLQPSKAPVVLVKPDSGVSTAEAYRAFDEDPQPIPANVVDNLLEAQAADDIVPFNNLAAASEKLMPELADVRLWLEAQAGVRSVLLCGSGATTFAVCSDFAVACRVAAEAAKKGWWTRTTSFGSIRAMIVPS